MVTVQTCRSVLEAEIVKSHLEGSGVPAFVPDEFAAQNSWAALDGVRVQVNEEDEIRALEVLKDAVEGLDESSAR